jgi:membrane protein
MRYRFGLVRVVRVAYDAYWRFVADDGWAIASHIALSGLMSLFPFLIFVTALAGFFGSKDLADEAVSLILEAWPQRVAGPMAAEMHNVLTSTRGDLLTIGVLLAIYFSSNGIESLRVGLNRAYGVKEERAWYLLRLESIAYVLVGAVALLALAFLVVLGPLIWATLVRYLPQLLPYSQIVTFTRLFVATVLIVVALVLMHLWLPYGKRRFRQIWPGVAVTVLLSLTCGLAFGAYLAEAAQSYVTTYAGLASVMIALVFLYTIASVFIYGGEFNAELDRLRQARAATPEA